MLSLCHYSSWGVPWTLQLGQWPGAFAVCSGCDSLVLSGLVLITVLSRFSLGYVAVLLPGGLCFSANLEFRFGIASIVFPR